MGPRARTGSAVAVEMRWGATYSPAHGLFVCGETDRLGEPSRMNGRVMAGAASRYYMTAPGLRETRWWRDVALRSDLPHDIGDAPWTHRDIALPCY